MNEFEARDYILEKGKNINSSQELAEFIEEVENNFNYDYGVAARSVGAVAACVANYLSNKMGLTHFQASCAMWEFIQDFIHSDNKCGMKLVDYDEMLYPQYEYKFCDKIIPKYTWESLQKRAKENLEEYPCNASPGVIGHWQSIVNGKVPFGYAVKE